MATTSTTRSSKKKAGAKATKYIFTTEQDTIIDNYMPYFKSEIERLGVLHVKNSSEIGKLKNSIADELLAMPEFQSLKTDAIPLNLWRETIKRKFANRLNNTLRHGKPDASTLSSDSAPPASGNASEVKAAGAMLHALIFSGNLTAHKLFASEKVDEIDAAVANRASDFPHLKGGALKNKIIAELWEQEDHDYWEERSESISMDIFENQKKFPLLIADALQGMCKRNSLGSCMMTLCYGFRDEDDGAVSGIIYTGYDATNDEKIAIPMLDHKELDVAWYLHADENIPFRVKETPAFDFSMKDGLPLFPQLNDLSMPPQEVVAIVKAYMVVLWETANPLQHKPQVPWDELADDPAKFYDTETYRLCFPIRSPAHYAKDPSEIGLLVKFLKASALSQNPFHFHTATDPASNVRQSATPGATSDSDDTLQFNSPMPSITELPSMSAGASAAIAVTTKQAPVAHPRASQTPDDTGTNAHSPSLDEGVPSDAKQPSPPQTDCQDLPPPGTSPSALPFNSPKPSADTVLSTSTATNKPLSLNEGAQSRAEQPSPHKTAHEDLPATSPSMALPLNGNRFSERGGTISLIRSHQMKDSEEKAVHQLSIPLREAEGS